MNINYRETQYNFLDNSAMSSRDPRSPRVLSAQLVLSVENLVIFSIVSIMVVIFFFSLGVERGKKVVLSEVNNQVSAVAKPARTAPEEDLLADDNSTVPQAVTKANFFQTLMASWKAKNDSSVKVAPSDDVAKDKSVATETSPLNVAPAVLTKDKPLKATPAATIAVTATATPSSGSYTVQVATYKSQKSAQHEAQNLKQKGYREVYVLPKGSFVIVCVGSFPTKSDASTFTRQLKNRYQDTVVRRL